MKIYQTPEVQLLYVSHLDIIATRGPNAENGYFIDGQGKDNNVMDWWG